MSPLRLLAVLPLVLALLAGCDSPPPRDAASGSMRLAISTPMASPDDVSRVTLTVSADDMTPLTMDLVLTDGVWGGLLANIPVGEHRTFLAQAFTASGTPRYEGRVEDVTITAGTQGLVSLTLQDLAPPAPLTNEAPLVDSLVVSSSAVSAGGTLTLSASAHDPNPGDTVSYAWTADKGSFSTPTQASTTWTAPSSWGPARLTLTVSDSRGAARTERFDVTVVTTMGWTPTGNMTEQRQVHTATLLPNGKVLITAGRNASAAGLTSTELYDPATGTWSSARPMSITRTTHPAVVMTDGRVLVAGGYSNTLATKQSDLYNPATDTWIITGSLITQRYAHTATLLPNGRVLVVGGINGSARLASAELYNPATGTWSATGSLSTARSAHTATLLSNGRVLVAGGDAGTPGYLTSAELYNPATGTWSSTGSLRERRSNHAATPLPDGKVLVSAGHSGNSSLATAELYNPATGTWSYTGALGDSRYDHQTVLLPNGKVLVAGGYGSAYLARVELYDPATGSWSYTTPMNRQRYLHSTTLLSNGKVLVAGGRDAYGSITWQAEVYDPGSDN